MRHALLIFSILAVAVICEPAKAIGPVGGFGKGGGHGGGHGIVRGVGSGIGGGGFGCGGGIAVGGFGGCYGGCDIAELYRQLYNNLPYFALHPPVYYSYPVPRTYGYSPFAYPPGVMTPDVVGEIQPLTINNPFVPNATKSPAAPTAEKSDRSAAISARPEPLVILNPFVTSNRAVAQTDR